jgi:hypothetical protein
LLTQRKLHSLVPVPRHWQLLLTQNEPAGHERPQEPQWLESLVTSTQSEPHCCCPPGQTQKPPWQVPPGGHVVLHPPQLPCEVILSTHWLPQTEQTGEPSSASPEASGPLTTDASGPVVPASSVTTTPASVLVETVWNPQMDAHADAQIARAGRRSAMARERITVPASQYQGHRRLGFPSRRFIHGPADKTSATG